MADGNGFCKPKKCNRKQEGHPSGKLQLNTNYTTKNLLSNFIMTIGKVSVSCESFDFLTHALSDFGLSVSST